MNTLTNVKLIVFELARCDEMSSFKKLKSRAESLDLIRMNSDLVTFRVETLSLQESIDVFKEEGVVNRSSQFYMSHVTRTLRLVKSTGITSTETVEW